MGLSLPKCPLVVCNIPCIPVAVPGCSRRRAASSMQVLDPQENSCGSGFDGCLGRRCNCKPQAFFFMPLGSSLLPLDFKSFHSFRFAGDSVHCPNMPQVRLRWHNPRCEELTLRNARLLSAQRVASVVVTILADRWELKRRATSPNNHPVCL